MPVTPVVLQAEAQRFAFGSAHWREVIAYDQCGTHAAICKGVQQVQAVDFLAAAANGVSSPSIMLVEVKDYRTSGMRDHNEIAMELAAKVFGSITGITAAARSQDRSFDWRSAAKALHDPKRRILVVLHVESSTWRSRHEAQSELSVLIPLLERKLAWLDGCTVQACCEQAPYIQDCTVTTV